mmetsp:Transcript_119829/g.168700  ORF Transcript_119829/g.168700 Transcript_119829/m.168700 type:complete len:242 (+) Transcript_119829:46-771(+)
MADTKDNKDKKGGRGFGKKGKGPKRGPMSEEWNPVTKLGRLVKGDQITSLEEIYKYSLPIKEHQIIDTLLKGKLKEEVMKIMPVQKQTTAGQRTRMKAFVLVGDSDGHIGLGVKCAKEVQGAIKGAIIDAKLNMVPVRRGYWGNNIGNPHTVPIKVTGKCGSVRVRLVPGPRGSGIVAAPASKKVIQLAGIHDCYTSSRGKTRTRGNFLKATYQALTETYKYLTPNLWKPTKYEKTLLERF